jgi:hypothetical protein
VEWRSTVGPVDRPIARVVDVPGGPLDTIVADPDVTTFLNDRFYALFRLPGIHPEEPVALAATVQFFRPDGCALTEPLQVGSPRELIDVCNAIVVRDDLSPRSSPGLTLRCAVPMR